MILAGGTGSRMAPLTRVTNKHLLPVGRYPMIYYPLHTLMEMGIEKILVTVGGESIADIMALLGSGREFGVEFTYRVQDQAGGIAQAVSLGEDFAQDDFLAVILGDNIFEDPISQYLVQRPPTAPPPLVQRPGTLDVGRWTLDGGKRAAIFLKEVPDPRRFGVVEFGPAGEPLRIIEKPADPPSSCAVTGLYVYDRRVFDIIRGLAPSARGELEITDVNNAYLARGEMAVFTLSSFWSDAGTFESCMRASNYVSERGLFWFG